MAFCPFMSTESNTVECDKNCKLYITEDTEEEVERGYNYSKRSYCAFSYMAKQANRADNVDIRCNGDEVFDRRYTAK